MYENSWTHSPSNSLSGSGCYCWTVLTQGSCTFSIKDHIIHWSQDVCSTVCVEGAAPCSVVSSNLPINTIWSIITRWLHWFCLVCIQSKIQSFKIYWFLPAFKGHLCVFPLVELMKLLPELLMPPEEYTTQSWKGRADVYSGVFYAFGLKR